MVFKSTPCQRRPRSSIIGSANRERDNQRSLSIAPSFKTDTTALVERSKTVPVLANLFKLPHLLLLGGGIVVKAGAEVVGAIGAARAPGGDLDDACARAGFEKIKDRLK